MSARDLVENGIEVLGELPRPYLEDGHLEISRFFGDEKVEGGMELLMSILKSR